MQGKENQWERSGKITQLLPVSPLNLKRRAGSIFPHCSSEQTCQARPDGHRRLMIIPLRMSLRLTETHWPIFLPNPQQRAAKISFGQCSGHPIYCWKQTSFKKPGGGSYSLIVFSSAHISHFTRLILLWISRLWLWTLKNTGDFIGVNVALTSSRAGGGCNHISIYFVLPPFFSYIKEI